MQLSVQIAHVVALLSVLWTCAVSHTVYRYPDKPLLPHVHVSEGYDQYSDHEENAYQPRQQPKQQAEPYTHCQYNGDILKNPRDRCSYLECHYGDEPWHNPQGKKQLYARVRQCPPGTAVSTKSKNILFRPIQYDPTSPLYKEQSKGYITHVYSNQGYGNQRGYKLRPTYKYKNSYADMTAICSDVVDGSACSVGY